MNPHLAKANLLLGMGRHAQTILELHKALALEPRNATCLAMLGICLTRRKQGHEGLTSVREAVALEPDNDYVHYALALVLSLENRYKSAEKAIREALRLQPQCAGYHALLAEILCYRDDPAQAVYTAQKGLALDPSNLECKHELIRALFVSDKEKQALALLEEALREHPESAYTHYLGGCIHRWQMRRGIGDERTNYRKAYGYFCEALRLDPEADYGGKELYATVVHQTVTPLRFVVFVLAGLTFLLVILAVSREWPGLPYLGFLWLWLTVVFLLLVLSNAAAWAVLRYSPYAQRLLTPLERRIGTTIEACAWSMLAFWFAVAWLERTWLWPVASMIWPCGFAILVARLTTGAPRIAWFLLSLLIGIISVASPWILAALQQLHPTTTLLGVIIPVFANVLIERYVYDLWRKNCRVADEE